MRLLDFIVRDFSGFQWKHVNRNLFQSISYGDNAGLKHGTWRIQAVKMLGLTNVCRRKMENDGC